MRKKTRLVQIGDKKIGAGNPILIQSMCNTKTEDVDATVDQILRLEDAGCAIALAASLFGTATLIISQPASSSLNI